MLAACARTRAILRIHSSSTMLGNTAAVQVSCLTDTHIASHCLQRTHCTLNPSLRPFGGTQHLLRRGRRTAFNSTTPAANMAVDIGWQGIVVVVVVAIR